MTLTALGVPTVPSRTDERVAAGQQALEVPNAGPLLDSYGRVATDLRVSLTDRCNLRCSYCMPAEGLDWLPRPTLLTDDETGGPDSAISAEMAKLRRNAIAVDATPAAVLAAMKESAA